MADKSASVDITITATKTMDSCRVCMSQGSTMNHIYDEDCSITDKIFYCTGLKFSKDDGFPSQICTSCLDDLAVAHKFKTLCILANSTFQKLIETEIKVELNDDENEHWDDDDSVRSIKEEDVTEEMCSKPVRKIRGPYKKAGTPRLKKLKFKRLWCSPCALRFRTKAALEEHRRETHADDEEERWVCEICGKVFVHRGSLSSHIKSHLPPEFGCDQCDYKTWNKCDLAKHVRIHKGEKIYQCQYCTASYYTSSNLASHIRRFHDNEKNFACDMCDRQFFDRTKYNRHIDSHNNVKRFECEVCHSCFTRRCYWKKHLHRQHNIVVPPQRPGKKVNFLVGRMETEASVI